MWKPEQLKNDAKITSNIKHTHFANDNLYMSRWEIGNECPFP